MRNKHKHATIVILFSVLFTIAFVACSNGVDGETDAAGNESAEVKEITFVAAQYSAETEPFLSELVENFEAENTDIKVNLEVIGWDNLEQSVNTMVSTGQTPDILNLNHFAAFVADDLLMPIEEVISPELKEKFYNSFYEAGRIDGTSYAIPYLATIRGLYYNKDLFIQAGISEPPTTWQELRETAKTIKEKTGVDGFGVPMTNNEGQAYFSYFIWGNGGDWKDGDEWVLNSPENVEALEFLTSLIREDKVTNPEPTAINREDLQRVFGQGQIGMMITANFMPTILASDAPDLNYGVGPIPVNEGADPVNLGVQDFLMVFNSTEHPESVGKFLDYLYDDEHHEAFMKAEGMLPATEPVGEKMGAEDELMKQFIEQLPLAKFYPLSDPAFSEMRLETIKAVQQAFLGEKTPQEALDDLQQIAEQH